jgi:hypothetical protein
MDIAAFWELVDKTREASGDNPLEQAKLLTNALAQLPEKEILAYDVLLQRLMDEAYRADLWEAAYILGCGCSDDGFMDFRAWLIGRGKSTFEQALSDPESLAEVVEVGQETQVGVLLYVAPHAYEQKTGKEDMPPLPYERTELKGESSPDQRSILERFPKLTAKFWKWCLEEFGK